MSLLLLFEGAPAVPPPFVFAPASRPARRRKANRKGRPKRSVAQDAAGILPPPAPLDWARRGTSIRGLYRVFGPAAYLFFRTLGAPPLETDTPFATDATLPSTPLDTFGDGEWFLSMAQTNGVLTSGFAPVGANGESYLRLSIAGGVEVGSPPQPPLSFFLELRAGGVVRVVALYDEGQPTRADTWVVNATFDGSPPDEDDATPTAELPIADGLAFLQYDLPAQLGGTVVTVRLQTRRTDAGPVDVWSEDSTAQIQVATADTDGPTGPTSATVWRGTVPGTET